MKPTIHPDPIVQANTDALFAYFANYASAADAKLRGMLLQPYDVSAHNSDGDTLLICAASKNSLLAVQAFVKAGAGLNEEGMGPRRYTPLFSATVSEHGQESALWLLDAGADIPANSEGRGHILICAISRNKGALLDRLLECGIDVNTRNGQGQTALHEAISTQHWAQMRKCIAAGADTDIQDPIIKSMPLVACINKNAHEALAILLSAGASIHVTDDLGCSALSSVDEYHSKTNEVLKEHNRIWIARLTKFAAGTYTPGAREDWMRLASVLPLEDPVRPPSVAARIQILHDMRPDISLGGMREKSLRQHQKAEGI